MRFRTTIELGGKTATGFRIPENVVADLGSGKRPAVRVTIGGHTYRTTVAPMGGAFMIPLSAENRAGAGAAAGDEVDVDVELDTEPRVVTVPPDFADALDRQPDARRAFDALSYSNQRRHVLSIEGAKTDETRQRRIGKAVDALRQG
ncbi:YdeI/OmpD-associated family protein [Rhodococcus sp. IEGM 1307]|uniref:YdeI/OmpD-associated family protein n=1 Tax=Rhodococcus sp. IEGM 1307 TaxID=3047091 RepID=UPI0024B7C12E|nr:YdeI/OmpD-associated family protein [Rhodococcus sp. IEGM 1307]MDI9974043.1 YdeI/OmpD-associated family protein [Rhodococcus sp. IEGM 1307]